MTIPVRSIECLSYRPNTDHFFLKKTQTKYGTLLLKIQTKIWKCHRKECEAEIRGVVSKRIGESVFFDIITEKHEISLGKYFLDKITIVLRKCVLQTKFFFNDRVVITAWLNNTKYRDRCIVHPLFEYDLKGKKMNKIWPFLTLN